MDKGALISGRYEIIRTLGEGGMANVYLVNDTKLNKQVALKALRYDLQDDEAVKRRFRREAKATSELSSPNIVNVLDVGTTEKGIQYIIIDYVEGPNLKKYIQQNYPIPYHEVVDIMEQIADAVSEAHSHGIIHRDLKPENILVDTSKDPVQVKVSDFGIALALSDRSITRTNSLVGSVHYMSPEQIRGGSATELSDIYAMGIILYEMLTKKVPFTGDTAVSVALKHSKDSIPNLRSFDPNIPQVLENIVLKATTKDPKQRYQSVKEMSEDLKTCLSPERANEPKFIPVETEDLNETKVLDTKELSSLTKDKPENGLSRRKKLAIVSGIIAAIILIFGIFMLSRSNQETSIPDIQNLTLKQSKVMLSASNLKVGQVQKENSDTIEAGHVIKTIPAKGVKLKNNSSVDLIVSLGAKFYKMPNLVGKDYDDVSDNLTKRGFKIKKKYVTTLEYNAGEIVKQSIKSGTKVKPKDKSLTITIAKSSAKTVETITLKNLVGSTLSSAQSYAEYAGINLNVTYDYSDTVENGTIISQSPSANATINQGSTVTVVVSKGKDTSAVSTVNKTINIPYSGESGGSNNIAIYINDNNHDNNSPYRTMAISSDTSVTLSFNLKSGETGTYSVVRDGQSIMNGSVNG
ncbi:Stk1 family PASTA domain-containing Ser/Thr kinase [Lactobacillus terrae]|uniref:Stk1 family PASTA domain-containing Ser/Thr kinase n=1 Tax=Lactobacillus terrae TaxID=2269374 RepID=UPI000C1B6DC6|nr:Stk1 family PASTA domain-containing Ser/Thr kinase [Lactobacillus terrae]